MRVVALLLLGLAVAHAAEQAVTAAAQTQASTQVQAPATVATSEAADQADYWPQHPWGGWGWNRWHPYYGHPYGHRGYYGHPGWHRKMLAVKSDADVAAVEAGMQAHAGQVTDADLQGMKDANGNFFFWPWWNRWGWGGYYNNYYGYNNYYPYYGYYNGW